MILKDIKKLIGFDEDYDAFDVDITILINSVLTVLEQVGVPITGRLPVNPTDSQPDWTDIFEDTVNLDMIKQYLYLRVKMVFDPPANGTIMEFYKETMRELEWRINLEEEAPHDGTYNENAENFYTK